MAFLAEAREVAWSCSALSSSGKAGSINHGFLGFLFSILSSSKHSINLSREGVDVSFKASLGSHATGIDGLDLIASSTSISNLGLNLALGTVCRVNESTAFFNLTRKSSSFAFRDANSFNNLSLTTGFVFEDLDGL